MSPAKPGKSPPPWEVLVLVATHLDPTTLAKASCVSKQWSLSMSSDHIWDPLLTLHFPTLSHLRLANPLLPRRRLYAMGRAAADRRLRIPRSPLLSLHNLLFLISITHSGGRPVISAAAPGGELRHKGRFQFDVDVGNSPVVGEVGEAVELVVTWNVVLEGWRAVFTVVEGAVGRVELGRGYGEGWFSGELPAPGCWWSETVGGVVGDLKVGFCEEGESGVRVNKVRVGILNVVNWRYVSLENGLNFLHHFLLSTDCS